MWYNGNGWRASVDWADIVGWYWNVLGVVVFVDNLEGLLVVVLPLFWDDSNPVFWCNLFLGADNHEKLEW